MARDGRPYPSLRPDGLARVWHRLHKSRQSRRTPSNERLLKLSVLFGSFGWYWSWFASGASPGSIPGRGTNEIKVISVPRGSVAATAAIGIVALPVLATGAVFVR
jgi:hypothetical protein